jgi:hypothetical protein
MREAMMSNIRVLDTKAKAKAEVVEMAKTILALAESGEIVDLSWAAANADGSSRTGFTATEDSHRRLATLSRLLHRLHLSWDEV